MSHQDSDTSPQRSAKPRGFGHSPRRIILEGLLVVGAVVAAGALILWSFSHLAEALAERLPEDADVALGQGAWNEVAPVSKRCTDPEAERYVESVAKLLLANVQSPFTFQFAVVSDQEVNAFALPGGFITVNHGLLERAGSGEEVAAVLAHEIAHVTERHGTKRIARQLGAMAVASLLFGGTDVESLGLVAVGLANTAYDREQEAEADAIGRATLERAGISPAAMSEFFERMDEATPGGGIPTFLSTHPDPGDRSKAAREAARGFTVTTKLPAPAGIACR